MPETARISKLFNDLFDGSPWLGVNLMQSLSPVSSETAAQKPGPGRNSIWEIVNHVINWRLEVLRRVQGEVIDSPQHNHFLPIEDTSEAAWGKALDRLRLSQEKWLSFLENFDEAEFDRVYPNNGMTYYEHIHGILQHDAYHLGQVVLLTKLL